MFIRSAVLRKSAQELFSRKQLIYYLVATELKAGKAGTRLGMLWWLLDPIILMFIYWFVFSLLLDRGLDTYRPYPIFVLCGLLCWKQFASMLGRCSSILKGRETLIKSVPFPVVVLPFSVYLAGLLQFSMGYWVCYIGTLLFPSRYFSGDFLAALQTLPLMLFQSAIFFGMGMTVAVIGVIVRDLAQFLPYILRVGFYMSGILYSVELVRNFSINKLGSLWGELLFQLYMLNPAATLIDSYRKAIFYGEWVSSFVWIKLMIYSVLSIWLGSKIFYYFEKRIIKFL